MSKSVYKCCGRVWAFYSWQACVKTGKFERDGKHYCGIHDPVKIAERQSKKTAEFDAKWNARVEAAKAQVKAEAEQKHKVDCFYELLAALQGVVRVADRATDEFDAARKAIAKAKAVQP